MFFKKKLNLFFLGLPSFDVFYANIDSLIRPNSITEFLAGIFNFLYWISFPIAVLMIIISGFMFVTSGGDPNRIQKGKDFLIYIGVGFLIIVLARGVIDLIATEFGS